MQSPSIVSQVAHDADAKPTTKRHNSKCIPAKRTANARSVAPSGPYCGMYIYVCVATDTVPIALQQTRSTPQEAEGKTFSQSSDPEHYAMLLLLAFQLTQALNIKLPVQCGDPRFSSLPTTLLPCQKELSTRDHYQYNLFGHECIEYNIESAVDTSVCFMTKSAFDVFGVEEALKNPNLCRCVGKTNCDQAHTQVIV